MIKKLFYGALSLSVLNANTQTISNVDWVKTKSERAQISNVPSAIDANNNAYITGYMYVTSNNANANTVKYSPTGAELWTASYDYNGGFDNSKAIILDAAGNSYITGESDGTTGRDVFVVKYDPNGLQLFAFRWNGASNGNDCGNAITLDGTGNIYITGFTTNMGGSKDYVTIKLNNSGVQQFAVITNGTGNLNDEAVAIGFNNNRLYITGNSTNVSGNTDLLTLRINPANGSTVWSKTENGSANSNDVAYSLLPYNNDVVVVGQVNNTTTNNDYFTKYYNGLNGNTVWSKIYDFNNTNGGATALTVDASGNFAVTGIVNNANIYEYHTLLYNNSGIQQWVNISSTNLSYVSALPQIAVDPTANHFYVCGQKLGVQSDICVYQITPSGNKTWEEKFNGAQNGTDAAVDLVVNAQGIIYVAGASLNSNAKYDYTTIRISQTPVYFPIDGLNEQPSELFAYTENKGQLVEPNGTPVTDIQYYIEGSSPNYFIKNNNLSFIFSKYDTIIATTDTFHKVDVVFQKSNNNTKAVPFEQYSLDKNYFINQTISGITNVKSSKRVMIPNIYPNIDLHYYSNQNGIKYYFVVKPGGDPNSIVHQFNGASSTAINGNSDLIINTVIAPLKLEKAYAYQVTPMMTIVPVGFQANWVNAGIDTYKFNVGTYNTALPLIFEIDQSNAASPTGSAADNMAWNTYVGGNRTDYFIDMERDNSGNIYALQYTNSQSFFVQPTGQFGAPASLVNGNQIFRFDKYGKRWVQTYVGANGGVNGNALAVLSDSSVVLVGTASNSLAVTVTNPPTSYTSSVGNSFILKFTNLNMNSSSWFTRYPGNAQDVDVNGNDDIYVLANAQKTGGNAAYLLSKPNALNLGYGNINGTQANVISRFNAIGTPIWSSFLPLNIPLFTTVGLKLDRQRNNYYVVGQINDTTDFKHFNKYNTFLQNTKKSIKDAVIQKYTANDTIIVSTLYGGNQNDELGRVEILSNGDACMVGQTTSSDYSNISFNPNDGSYFNVSGSYLTNFGNGNTGWLHKFDSVMKRKWSITYGDSIKSTSFNTITKDMNDNIFIGGLSSGMQTVNNLIGAYYQSTGGNGNAAFLMFDGKNQRKWATFMGDPNVTMSGPGLVQYNPANNNLVFSGGATANTPPLYPYRNFTTPVQAYWQPNVAAAGYGDGYAGRFNLTGVVGIKENGKDKITNSLFIYPNPSSETVTINLDSPINKPYSIKVYNNLGQVVYLEYVTDVHTKTHTLNVSYFTTGIYFINITSQEINKTAKFIKE
ncbi:MAG: T9SS type A sorting domain-containing protein [Bacteroidetes bacterium]|nr:T9SS type A sorting domain-containing protein [Bacteroidota bacterium]